MCGIVGWLSATHPVQRGALERMTDRIAHRGPDGRGTWFTRDDRIAFGHRRLAILDLGPGGAQPMHLPGRGLSLTYNGEIYNHPELRERLEGLGHVYRTRSDTETILHAYAAWGPDCVTKLRGMFAFALWDEQEGRALVVRDPLGIKPLYYHPSPSGLAFASQPSAFLELPGFEPRIDPDGFLDFLLYGVVPGDRAAYQGVRKLPPASALTWEEGHVSVRTYWSPPEEPDIFDAAEAVERIQDRLGKSVRAQLMGDVPVATFLSGGIDSSAITAIAARTARATRTFTMGFDVARSDERPFAAKVAEICGTDAVVGALDASHVDRMLEDVVEAYDEPFGIGAALPMTALARTTADHGTKVVLSGDGADELFAGYRHYDALADHYRRHGHATRDRVHDWPRKLWSRLRHEPFDPFSVYTCHNGEMSVATRNVLAGDALAGRGPSGRGPSGRGSARWRESEHFPSTRGPVDAGQRCDLVTYLPDEILVKVDRATMAFGVEARVPFLDHELVELAFRIAPELRYGTGERKAILKEASRAWLPAEVLTQRKKGFSAPLGEWLAEDGRDRRMLDALFEGSLVAHGYLKRDAIEPAIAAQKRPMAGLLQLYLAERWARRWVFEANGAR